MSFQIGFCCLCIFFLFSFVLLLSLVVGACSSSPCKIRSITNWEQINNNKWLRMKKYFTSCDPHHDIYTFCYWQIFWHSIWHFIWHSIWHFIWHSIWHTFWHSIWHIFWHSIWHSIWHIFWHIFWHSIWHSICISSGILSGRWGPAVHTEQGRSQVEVQRCTLSWAGPRLRSSGAHWAGQVPGWGPAVHIELGSWQRAWRRESAKRVGKELGEELARRKCTWKLMQTWSRRNWRRRTRRKRTASRGGGGGRGRGGRALW